MKKSNFKVLSEAIVFNRLKDAKLPTNNLKVRRVQLDELKDLVKEEFGDVKQACDVKVKELEGSWGAEDILAKELEWMKAIDIKEVFKKK